MASIKCSECGKDVSDKVITCPNCGCPITIKSENNTQPIYWNRQMILRKLVI